jgi:LmbE family N-acetylglucosaminyl deacetylase
MIGLVRTVVAFHAHPDDEVLLTGGTLARLASDGHRVVIVVATDGSMAEASDRRLQELRASAKTLAAATVVHLGYADSGRGPVLFPNPAGRKRFARADLDEAATRLAAILREEHAGLLLSYDAGGGYGHRDHIKVHQVGAWRGVREPRLFTALTSAGTRRRSKPRWLRTAPSTPAAAAQPGSCGS